MASHQHNDTLFSESNVKPKQTEKKHKGPKHVTYFSMSPTFVFHVYKVDVVKMVQGKKQVKTPDPE